ncbi:MAG: hypothetical protein H6730_06435 [Deltaproteobacteria bacterium]|nr:hypothetical protein [Deltaproteobacteria bacterium]
MASPAGLHRNAASASPGQLMSVTRAPTSAALPPAPRSASSAFTRAEAAASPSVPARSPASRTPWPVPTVSWPGRES